MNREQARQILALYRPGAADAVDSQVAEALALAKRDPELDAWLEQQLAVQLKIRARFDQIPVPAGLRERILAERPLPANVIPWQPAAVLAAVAALFILFLGATDFWVGTQERTDFGALRNRLVRKVVRDYRMDLMTNNLAAIQQHLVQHQAPGDYTLTAELVKTPAIGCAVLRWQEKPVSLLCFEPEKDKRVWLFVAESSAASNVPRNETPQFTRVSRLLTATWRAGDKTYILAAEGDEDYLRKFL